MTTEPNLADIAARYFGTDTLDERHCDKLDFYDVHVANIYAALRAAYEAGKAATQAG